MRLQYSSCRLPSSRTGPPRLALLCLIPAILTGFGGKSPLGTVISPFDADAVVLAYHKVSGDPLDLEDVARRSAVAARAGESGRPAAVHAEVARLQSALAATSAAREFSMRVNDSISEYDAGRGEFSIALLTPGHAVRLEAFGQCYRLVFANAAGAGRVAIPKAFMQELDARLNALGRVVVHEIRFRVVGSGDPSGVVSGPRVIRAKLVSSRLLDRTGRLLITR